MVEPLGLTALAIQVISGLWMAWLYRPGFRGLFHPANPIGMLAIAFVVVGALIRLGGWS
ncbi:hypothetical protein [Synechococcus sp. GFB01]|uniref:hypothetical protein n=1 Tax=Synechococcus sp. GFB01 TaxID=1662190 RepID=UPI000B21A203|nr:hypothetical protein [Synechococcus sp. GFB01]